MTTILILSPHTDDAELGCGGAIAKFVEEENERRCAYRARLARRERSRRIERGYRGGHK